MADKPYWLVSLEWIGNKPQVLPLIEYAVREVSESSGACVDGSGVCDASWSADKEWKGNRIFIRLRSICASTRFSPFIRLRFQKWEQKGKPRLLKSFRRGKAPVIKIRKRAA